MLRNQTYTDKVSYYIDVVKSDYEAFINFLNQMTAGNFDLTEETQSSYLSIYQLNKNKNTSLGWLTLIAYCYFAILKARSMLVFL